MANNNIVVNLLILISLFIYQAVMSILLLFVPRMFRKKKNIEGQRVLITGAGNGVGRQLAIEFSKHSVCLILVDLNREWLLKTEKLLDRRSSVFIYECNVSNHAKVYAMAEEVRRDAGDVDILVNNAGTVTGKYLQDLTEEAILKTMRVNAFAHFWTCKAFLPAMMAKNSGHLVSILSLCAKGGYPRLTDYCSSKYAALGFAESLETELREQNLDGIKVTTVCPAHMSTGLFKGAIMKNVGGVLTPERVAREVVLGVLEEREMVVVPHFLTYAMMIKEFFPRWITIKSMELTGNIKGMNNFVGRHQEDVSSQTRKQNESQTIDKSGKLM